MFGLVYKGRHSNHDNPLGVISVHAIVVIRTIYFAVHVQNVNKLGYVISLCDIYIFNTKYF